MTLRSLFKAWFGTRPTAFCSRCLDFLCNDTERQKSTRRILTVNSLTLLISRRWFLKPYGATQSEHQTLTLSYTTTTYFLSATVQQRNAILWTTWCGQTCTSAGASILPRNILLKGPCINRAPSIIKLHNVQCTSMSICHKNHEMHLLFKLS